MPLIPKAPLQNETLAEEDAQENCDKVDIISEESNMQAEERPNQAISMDKIADQIYQPADNDDSAVEPSAESAVPSALEPSDDIGTFDTSTEATNVDGDVEVVLVNKGDHGNEPRIVSLMLDEEFTIEDLPTPPDTPSSGNTEDPAFAFLATLPENMLEEEDDEFARLLEEVEDFQ